MNIGLCRAIEINAVFKNAYYESLNNSCLMCLLFFGMVISHMTYNDAFDIIQTRNPLHISSIATTNDGYIKYCAPRIKCDSNAKYRNLNGYCNNLENPTWGASETPFIRMINANYSDGKV